MTVPHIRRSLLRHTLVAATLLCAVRESGSAQSFTGGFTFALPAVDTFAVPFLPSFPKRPIAPTEFVGIDGDGHFSAGGKRIRFFGTNCVADGAFPAQQDVWFIAGRLRKMGYNLVRMHHLDNGWTSTGSMFAGAPSTRSLDPGNLDKFERFVAELKANGIYVNVNLHVGRTFTKADGVPDADSLKDFAKGYTFFDPLLIALQKEYARELLTHPNPYTGLPLVSDPVMGMVETTNENSLYFLWRNGALRPYAAGGILPVRHQHLLDSLWGVYLRQRYGTTAALLSAWNAGASESGPEMAVNGSFEGEPFPGLWVLEQHTPSSASVARTVTTKYDGAIASRVIVTAASGPSLAWHVQWKHTGLSVIKDTLYMVRFAARADSVRTIDVSVTKDVSPYTWYGSTQCTLDTSWQVFTFVVRAPETSTSDVRLSFALGAAVATYWIDGVSMKRSPHTGALAGESLEQTPRRLLFSECGGFTDARVADMTGFYMKVQSDFYSMMRSYLRDSLGVHVPIVGTNWNFGPPDLAVQSASDYIDNHAYWDHPNFPGIPWSSTDWTIANQPMVRATDGATVGGLFGGDPVSGKPYTISEYNHPFPNRFGTEGPLFLTAYGAFHDIDGFMFFDYYGGRSWVEDRVESYFDMHRNTAQMILMPTLARVFRNGWISSARQTVQVQFTAQDVRLIPRYDLWSSKSLSPVGGTLPLVHGVRTSSYDALVSNRDAVPDAGQPPYVSDTGELRWDPAGSFSVNAPSISAVTGFAGGGVDAGAMQLVAASDHVTILWLSLDSLSLADARRSLITVATRVQNTGMVWDGTNTIHNAWGGAPTLYAPVQITLRLRTQADSLRLSPLTVLGGKGATSRMLLPSAPGIFQLPLDLSVEHSPWFGVEAFGTGPATSIGDPGTVPPSFALEQNYPNPFNGSTRVVYSVGGNAGIPRHVKLAVYDLLGRQVALLADGSMVPGRYAATFDAGTYASGVYIIRLELPAEGIAPLLMRKALLIR
jgi:hypothetical protein